MSKKYDINIDVVLYIKYKKDKKGFYIDLYKPKYLGSENQSVNYNVVKLASLLPLSLDKNKDIDLNLTFCKYLNYYQENIIDSDDRIKNFRQVNDSKKPFYIRFTKPGGGGGGGAVAGRSALSCNTDILVIGFQDFNDKDYLLAFCLNEKKSIDSLNLKHPFIEMIIDDNEKGSYYQINKDYLENKVKREPDLDEDVEVYILERTMLLHSLLY